MYRIKKGNYLKSVLYTPLPLEGVIDKDIQTCVTIWAYTVYLGGMDKNMKFNLVSKHTLRNLCLAFESILSLVIVGLYSKILLSDIPPCSSPFYSIVQFMCYVVMILIHFVIRIITNSERLMSSKAPPQPDVGPKNTFY